MKTVIEAAAKTDVGVVRTNNEDNFGYDASAGIFVVCDGMGGHAAGELASRIATGTVLDHFAKPLHSSSPKLLGKSIGEVSQRANHLASAIQLANSAIRDACIRDPQLSGMGSTIVAVLVEGLEFSIGHVGDSRAYMIRNGIIHQLTNDHSLVMEQVRRGMITAEEAVHSKMQNVIMRALGAEDSVEPDLLDHELVAGDVLLLCSDGLSRHVDEAALADIIARANSLDSACGESIALAKAGGSDDNITCLLLRLSEQSWEQHLLSRLARTGGSHTSWS
jgi:protein phosphatase